VGVYIRKGICKIVLRIREVGVYSHPRYHPFIHPSSLCIFKS
jgi:hypothetical protein